LDGSVWQWGKAGLTNRDFVALIDSGASLHLGAGWSALSGGCRVARVIAIPIFYILLLMARSITQLILYGRLIKSLCRTFGSAKNLARRLAESMRNHPASADLPLPGQIRFQPP
jgi:hypothetical protein